VRKKFKLPRYAAGSGCIAGRKIFTSIIVVFTAPTDAGFRPIEISYILYDLRKLPTEK
jgi:hypothetical protein